MAANSCGSMSSCCIGLKAGPAGFPERVRPGTAGCPPGWVSGKTVPLSTFGINCASSSSKRPGGWHPGSLGVVAGYRLLLACDLRRPGYSFDYAHLSTLLKVTAIEGLRGPAPHSYNGDGHSSRAADRGPRRGEWRAPDVTAGCHDCQGVRVGTEGRRTPPARIVRRR